jgi:hypothetical protein
MDARSEQRRTGMPYKTCQQILSLSKFFELCLDSFPEVTDISGCKVT